MTIQTEVKTKHTIWPFNMNLSSTPDGALASTIFTGTVNGIFYEFTFYRNASVIYCNGGVSGTATAALASYEIGQSDSIRAFDTQLKFFYFDSGDKVFKIEVSSGGHVRLNCALGDVLTTKIGVIDFSYRAAS